MHDDDGKKSVLGGGSIVGIGQVAGKRVLISASDSAVKGGTVAPMGLKKGLRAQAIALQNKLPLVSLVESGGANLMYQADIFVDGGRSLPTRRACRPRAFRRSPWCTVHPRRAGLTCRACRTMWCW
jgi:acetyl-CoA carboxylase carboxyltransferase component